MGLFTRDSGSGADDADGEEPRFWHERGFIASAIVVGAVVVCLLVWFFVRGGSDAPTTRPSETPSTVVPTEQPTEEPSVPPATPTEQPIGITTPRPTPPQLNGTGGCHNKHPDTEMPQVAPPAVSWQFEADMLIPLQEAAGPAVTSPSGVHSCFAHSPTGAVLATMVMLGQVLNPRITDEVLTTRVMPGPGRTKALAAAARELATPGEKTQVQFAGFKIFLYQQNLAIIQVASELNHQAVASMPVTMRWTGSDWKAVLQEDGTFNGHVEPDVLQSLDGYVRFSGAQ